MLLLLVFAIQAAAPCLSNRWTLKNVNTIQSYEISALSFDLFSPLVFMRKT